MPTHHPCVTELPDSELLTQLSALVKQEQHLTATVLLHLAEVETRGLHLTKGCSSLFAYCVERLGFSEDVAYKRVGAARYGRRFPLALDLVAEGSLHLSALMLVGPHLTDANHRDWLMAAAGKSKREIEKLVATRCPKPDVASSVRKLPNRQTPATAADANLPSQTAVDAKLPSGTRAADRPRVQPLSGNSYRIVFTASEALKHKLERARELCSHSVASGDLPALVERALDVLIEREEKRRFTVSARKVGSTKRTRKPRDSKLPSAASAPHHTSKREPDLRDPAVPCKRTSERPLTHLREREQEPDLVDPVLQRKRLSDRGHADRREKEPDPGAATIGHRREPASVKEFSRCVPASVSRAVWKRDAGQCSFVDDEGHRCTERRYLEIDHVVAFARGGPTSIGNCRLLCRGHNLHQAKRIFGTEFMDRARARPRTR